MSIASVLLLAIVSLRQASTDPVLFGCLVAGAVTAILGIALCWIVHARERREKVG